MKKLIIGSFVVISALISLVWLFAFPKQVIEVETQHIATIETIQNITVIDPHTKEEIQAEIQHIVYHPEEDSDSLQQDSETPQEIQMIMITELSSSRRLLQEGSNKCIHTPFGESSTYIQCDDGSINVLHTDFDDIFEDSLQIGSVVLKSILQQSIDEYNGEVVKQVDEGLDMATQQVTAFDSQHEVTSSERVDEKIEAPVEEQAKDNGRRFLSILEKNYIKTINSINETRAPEDQIKLKFGGFFKKVFKTVVKAVTAVAKVVAPIANIACKVGIFAPASCVVGAVAKTIVTVSQNCAHINLRCGVTVGKVVAGRYLGGKKMMNTQFRSK